MNSRYDFMEASSVKDIDDEVFPDILSEDYSKFYFTEVPTPVMVSAGTIQKFWLYMQENYGIPYYDDLLLNMNGIPYIGMLEPGSTIWNISLNDMKNYKNNIRKEFK